MYCPVESKLYIKANGEIPCWCAYGENKILFKATDKTNIVKSILFGESYTHIRESLKENKLPWPQYCSRCFFYNNKQSFYSQLIEEKKIDTVQIEPSYLCQLDCVACFPSKKDRMSFKEPPYIMSLKLFKNIINCLYSKGYIVGHFDFQGRGEPLLNKYVWKMVTFTRKHFPESKITLTTNGNFSYNYKAVHSGLSAIVISADGCFQDTYETYRRNGNVEKAFKFMEGFAKEKKKSGVEVELLWKYILFGHNDSDKELIATQQKAIELGVDLLFFEVTNFYHTCKPTRFTKEKEMSNFPLIDTGDSSLYVILPDEKHVNMIKKRVY